MVNFIACYWSLEMVSMSSPTLKAVILAGGLGTRLRPYTLFVPKPMLPLAEKPLLQYTIEWLRDNGVKDIVISVSYLRKTIEDYFEDGQEFGVNITYYRLAHPIGTAGQLKTTEKHLNSRFVCIYGDSVYNFDLKDAVSFHEKNKALATVILKKYKTSMKYGFIDIGKDGTLEGWREKPEMEGLINIGCYIMEPRFLSYIPAKQMYGMDMAFRKAVEAGERIYGYETTGEFIDIGDMASYEESNSLFTGRLGKVL
jgi:mannose-1-phosphate guanylyltransferase